MLSTVLSALVMLAIPAVQAEPSYKLSQNTLERIDAMIAKLKQQSEELVCVDPFQPAFSASSGLSESASIVDQIAYAEMHANPWQYSTHASQLKIAVSEISDLSKEIPKLAKRWLDIRASLEACKKNGVSAKDCYAMGHRASDLVVHLRITLLDIVIPLQSKIYSFGQWFPSQSGPLSLKGPIENILEKSESLLSDIYETAEADFKWDEKKPATTIQGDRSPEDIEAKLADFAKELESAKKFYADQDEKALRLARCPRIGEQLRLLQLAKVNSSRGLIDVDRLGFSFTWVDLARATSAGRK